MPRFEPTEEALNNLDAQPRSRGHFILAFKLITFPFQLILSEHQNVTEMSRNLNQLGYISIMVWVPLLAS